MIYVTSDLHGCHPDAFQALLDRSGFTENDFLFILGDVIDRGEYGAELLLWLTQQPNVQLILGNHEALLLACGFLFEEVTEESLAGLSIEKLSLAQNWMENGGSPTLAGLRKILRRDPELLQGMLEDLRDAPLYEILEAGGRTYILTHAGLGNFRPDRPLEDYSPEELLLARPALDTRYFDQATVIFGHTPTSLFDPAHHGRALRTPTWICIDTGAALSGSPMLLRLEDGKEFY